MGNMLKEDTTSTISSNIYMKTVNMKQKQHKTKQRREWNMNTKKAEYMETERQKPDEWNRKFQRF